MTRDVLIAQRLMPVYSHAEQDTAILALQAVYDAGLRVFEFTNRHENALDVFLELKKYAAAVLPGMVLGAGTIKTVADAEMFAAAGASFLVSPLVSAELISFTRNRDIFWIPGCATPSEVGMAERSGIQLVKIFPAGAIGGPAFIRSLKDVFPAMRFMATGGIKLEKAEIGQWYAAGTDIVGLGSQLFGKDAINQREIINGIKAIAG